MPSYWLHCAGPPVPTGHVLVPHCCVSSFSPHLGVCFLPKCVNRRLPGAKSVQLCICAGKPHSPFASLHSHLRAGLGTLPVPIGCLLLVLQCCVPAALASRNSSHTCTQGLDLWIGQKNKNHCVGAFLCLFTYLASKQSGSWRLCRMEKRKGNQALRL